MNLCPIAEMETALSPADVEFSKVFTSGAISPPKGKIAHIRSTVCRVWHITEPDFLSDRRSLLLVNPRFAAAVLCKRLTKSTYPVIAREAHRDPTSILHSVKRGEELLAGHCRRSGRFQRRYSMCLEELLDTGFYA